MAKKIKVGDVVIVNENWIGDPVFYGFLGEIVLVIVGEWYRYLLQISIDGRTLPMKGDDITVIGSVR